MLSHNTSVQPIKTIFIQKMALSALAQMAVFFLITLLSGYFISSNQISKIAENLLINDLFSAQEIGRFHLLKNDYAMNLAMYEIQNERKLDYVEFSNHTPKILSGEKCHAISREGFKVCRSKAGRFRGITPVHSGNTIYGYIVTKKKYDSSIFPPIPYFIAAIPALVAAIFAFNLFFLFSSVKKRIILNIKNLANFVLNDGGNSYRKKINIVEFRDIAEKISDERLMINALQKEKSYFEACKSIADQVAHDIRSPLGAINMAIADSETIHESKRMIIRSASARINEIANNLLDQTRKEISATKKTIDAEPLFLIIDQIVSEKQEEHRGTDFKIQLNLSVIPEKCFCRIDPAIYRRIFSNLINNSIESLDRNGCVSISILSDADMLIVSIKDNARGIPEEILPKITEKGFSFAKDGGTGIGLSYALECIENASGKLIIESKVGSGTEVRVALPKATAPRWFVGALEIDCTKNIVIIDNDISTYHSWKNKFNFIPSINIKYYSEIHKLPSFGDMPHSTLYLVSYELSGHPVNGLDIIKKHIPTMGKAFLVTDYYENKDVKNRCDKDNIKIIPRSFINKINIICILIDSE